MSSSDPSQTSLSGEPLAGKLAGPVLKVDANGKSMLQLYISPPGPEQIRMIGVHGPSGCGKSTSEIDILLHACEEGWVAGLASNIEVNNIPYTYQHLDYLTDLINIRKVGLGLDELNSCLDGWSWKEEMHQKFAHIVDQSRRRECSVLVATSIRETGVSSHLRRSITMVIAPLGKMTTDGYPIYAVFPDYWAYSQYLSGNPKAPYTVCYGFHKVADLKQVFDSMKEPKLLPYPPVNVREETSKFELWATPNGGRSFLYNGEGRLVQLNKLRLHISRWNRTSRDIPFRQADLEEILSYLYQKQDGRVPSEKPE